ncbi:MAG: glutamine--tRNA ligase/YqeY domain fusion protein [bacterium]|nr:glutamine--tRNA ligase/YqeY domain fusion protein [bacterium]
METPKTSNFIRDIINQDIKEGAPLAEGAIVETRFPPEPNGHLHIGHAKSICLNFGLAAEYNGVCHLRFDDTNPTKEEAEYVEAIKRDVKWLGFDWGQHLYYTSDYFDRLYKCAVELIKKGKAFVCHLSPDEIRQYRGTLTHPGQNSPYRERLVDENLELFEGMRQGKFEEGSCVLRARIDMSSPNLNMRDPVLYRIIKNTPHHRTGTKWCIYPSYDYSHPISDAIEGITHSICTLEFEDHRPLYDWILNELSLFKSHPKQIEFARLNLTYTVMSKRKLLELVSGSFVTDWDDPRMPTISGLRRRGYTPEAIRKFCEVIGVAKANSIVDIALLEYCLREDLNQRAARVMAVLNPLRLVIDNYPEDLTEELEAENNPEDASMGSRKIPFGKVIYIEQDDFCEQPPKGYFRLAPGCEVRLKHAYYVKCVDVIKDNNGRVVEVHCTYDPETKGGWSKDGRKVMGTLHWVSVEHAIPSEVRIYSHLFTKPNPEDEGAPLAEEAPLAEITPMAKGAPLPTKKAEDFKSNLNPESLIKLTSAMVEPSLANADVGNRYQFLRHGYFCVDADSVPNMPIFNRTVSLKDSWARSGKAR